MPIKPLLSATLTNENASALRFPLQVSPKIDGIRTLFWKGCARSRDWNPLPNRVLQGHAESGLLDGLDCEAVAGSPCDPLTMSRSQSMLRKADAQPTEENPLTLWVFDICSPESVTLPFAKRLALAKERVANAQKSILHPHVHIKHLDHSIVSNMDALLGWEQIWLAEGFEGLMARSPTGLYKNGRSTIREHYMVKVKRFEEDTATIIGVEELQHNENEDVRSELGYAKRSSVADGLRPGGTLGALIVKVETGIFAGTKVKIGSGFTAAQRAELWRGWLDLALAGRKVLFKHFPYGALNAPRLPIFKKVLP